MQSNNTINGNKNTLLKKKKYFSELKYKNYEYSDPTDVLTLLNDVIRYLNSTDDFNKALSYAINKICLYSSWDIGHSFILSNNKLISSGIWNSNIDGKFDKIKEIKAKTIYNIGEGIVGICFENKKPFWLLLSDIYNESHFPIIEIAIHLGIKAGVWIPILCGDKTIAVMEFFSEAEREPGKQMINAIMNIADELGNLMEKNIVMEKIKLRDKLLKETQKITQVGSWEENLRTGEVYFSDELYNILHIENKDKIPTLKELKKLIYPEDIQYVERIFNKFLKNPFSFNLKFRICIGDDVKYIYSVTRVDFDSEKKPLRIYGSIQDLTNIKQYEDEINLTNKKLREAQKNLINSEKLAVLGRFSAGIAHEIRNPLANISALSQLMIKQSNEDKMIKHLKMILDNTLIANQIIKDLLNYASPEELELNDENLLEILNDVALNIKARCEKNKINLKVNLEDKLPSMRIDKLRMKSAIMNFISNSIEAMTDGGDLVLNANLNKHKDLLIIEISDTGPGIPRKNFDKIFEPFFTTKHDGTGLGLGLAHQGIKLHNGEIKLKSKVNAGTTIIIELPVLK